MTTRRHDNKDNSAQRLVSEFSGDAEMAELIEYFLCELQTGVHKLNRAFEEGDQRQLCQLAHQLKGAAGGYGFPSITDSAAELERLLHADQAEASAVAERVEDLLVLCNRAINGAESASSGT